LFCRGIDHNDRHGNQSDRILFRKQHLATAVTAAAAAAVLLLLMPTHTNSVGITAVAINVTPSDASLL